MPLTSAEKAKRWRDKHPDTYHARQKRYYDNHPDKSHARVVRFRMFKSECKRLMNILLD